MNGEWCESFESPEAQFLSVFRSLASHVCAPILDLYAQEPFDQPDIPWLVEQVFRKTIMLNSFPAWTFAEGYPQDSTWNPKVAMLSQKFISESHFLRSKVTFSGSFAVIHPTFVRRHCRHCVGNCHCVGLFFDSPPGLRDNDGDASSQWCDSIFPELVITK